MKPVLHRCAAVGCARQVPTHLLMCIDHWRLVPAPVQREVTSTWSFRRRSRENYTAVRAHTDAVEKAVAAVATKQTAKAARRAEVEGDLFALTAAASATDSQHQEEAHGNDKNSSGRESEK